MAYFLNPHDVSGRLLIGIKVWGHKRSSGPLGVPNVLFHSNTFLVLALLEDSDVPDILSSILYGGVK